MAISPATMIGSSTIPLIVEPAWAVSTATSSVRRTLMTVPAGTRIGGGGGGGGGGSGAGAAATGAGFGAGAGAGAGAEAAGAGAVAAPVSAGGAAADFSDEEPHASALTSTGPTNSILTSRRIMRIPPIRLLGDRKRSRHLQIEQQEDLAFHLHCSRCRLR